MKIYQCLVVDDEEFSRTVIAQYVGRTAHLKLFAQCPDAIEAFGVLKNNPIDIAFLDIEMPEMTGLELVKNLTHPPQIVLITSRASYAVEAFEHSVVDYLIKPVKYARFLKAVERVSENLEKKQNPLPSLVTNKQSISIEQPDFFIKTDGKIVRFKSQDILYVEALSDYVVLHTLSKKHVTHSTMKGIAEKLGEDFTRVHRSYIVNIHKIESIEDDHISIHQAKIPIGVSYKQDFLAKLNFL